MKITKYLSIFASIALISSCSSDGPKNPGDKTENDTPTSSADIDYNEKNAASWGNYMSQVSALLSTDASTLYNSWATSYEGGPSFAEIFKTHNTSRYSSAHSCVEQMIEGCADIANEVGTAKIGEPYNLYMAGEHTRALYAVESWYSWHSREDYSNNILSIRNTYYGSLDGKESEQSLSKLVASLNPGLDAEVKQSIKDAYDAILNIPIPFRSNINSRESREAMSKCADLDELLSGRLKNTLSNFSEEQLQKIVENYVDNVVLPTYLELRDLNGELHQTILAFKSNPSNEGFARACEAWLKARQPWEKSEAFLFGPVDDLGLDPNMDSWPLDQDNIVQILNSGNYDDLDWTDGNEDDEIEAKQAVRGFHTLEFLLFKDGQPRTVNKQ